MSDRVGEKDLAPFYPLLARPWASMNQRGPRAIVRAPISDLGSIVFLPSDSVWLISRDWSPRTIRMRTAKNQKWYLSQKKWYLSHFAKTQKEILTLYPEVTPEPT